MEQSTKRNINKYINKRPREQITHSDWNEVVNILATQIDSLNQKINDLEQAIEFPIIVLEIKGED